MILWFRLDPKITDRKQMRNPLIAKSLPSIDDHRRGGESSRIPAHDLMLDWALRRGKLQVYVGSDQNHGRKESPLPHSHIPTPLNYEPNNSSLEFGKPYR